MLLVLQIARGVPRGKTHLNYQRLALVGLFDIVHGGTGANEQRGNGLDLSLGVDPRQSSYLDTNRNGISHAFSSW